MEKKVKKRPRSGRKKKNVTRHIKRYLKGPSDKIEILTSFSRANLKL